MVKGAAYARIVDIGLEEHGLFVGIKDDGTGRVVRVDDNNTGLKVIWEYADSVSIALSAMEVSYRVSLQVKAAQYTESMYSGGVDKDGYPYIARVFWSYVYKVFIVAIVSPSTRLTCNRKHRHISLHLTLLKAKVWLRDTRSPLRLRNTVSSATYVYFTSNDDHLLTSFLS